VDVIFDVDGDGDGDVAVDDRLIARSRRTCARLRIASGSAIECVLFWTQ
jgi:hypothetical protein